MPLPPSATDITSTPKNHHSAENVLYPDARQQKRTKIVCTMGPSTEDDNVLRELMKAGMNVARFNFSHGDHAYHETGMKRDRRISK